MTDTPLNQKAYEESLRDLQMAYVERLKRDEAALARLNAQCAEGAMSAEDLQKARHLAHGLSGSGKTFGFSAVSEAGGAADRFLTAQIEFGLKPDPRELQRFLLALLQSCQDAIAQQNKKDAPVDTGQNIVAGSYILLIDDDAELSAFLSAHLEQRGIHVTAAASGEDALKILGRQSPDLIILDMMMPGINGHDLLKIFRHDQRFSRIPVMILSSRPADPENKDETIREGTLDYVQKPFDQADLMTRVENILMASRHRVVIADNDPILLSLLQQNFRRRGFHVTVQEDGKMAWDYIFKALPDLVILDRMMPGMDGLAVLKHMRDEPETRDIPVIIVSARRDDRDIKMGYDFGASDYVKKPCDPADLIARALTLLQNPGSKAAAPQA